MKFINAKKKDSAPQYGILLEVRSKNWRCRRRMNLKERMSDLQEKQEKLLADLELLVKEYEATDLFRDHEELKQDYDLVKSEYEKLKQIQEKMLQENTYLKTALSEQIFDEKLNILKVSKRKLETYFNKERGAYRNKLDTLEQKTKKQIELLRNRTDKQLGDDKEEVLTEIKRLSVEVAEKIHVRREQLALEERALLEGLHIDIDRLNSEPVNEEVIQKRIKQNQIEMKIGLNWINKIGIILILLGVSAAAKYTYSTWFNEYMKGISFFVLGGGLLGIGEWAYRKNKKPFATGLLGGGISVLYGAIFYSYFLLEIINLTTGLLLSVIITLLSIILSLRYQSRTICSLGLIGGYFPFFSYVFVYGLSGNNYYIAMGYLFLLNLSVLLISLWKKWNITNYISFLFHFPSLFFLVLNAPDQLIGIAYSLLTFLMYLGITLTYSFRKNKALNKLDVILLAMNTFFSFGVIYLLFDKAGLGEYQGLLALIFSLVFIGLGQFVEKIMRDEKPTMILFYATSLTFAILMIPLQFGVQWLAFGWFIEGAVLILSGYRIKQRLMEAAGWGLFLFSILVFYIFDSLLLQLFGPAVRYFDFKYAVITVGMLFVMYFYLKERAKNNDYSYSIAGNHIRYFKYWVLLNLWFYSLYTGTKIYDYWVPIRNAHYDFYRLTIVALITFAIGYFLAKFPLLQDRIVRYYRMLLYAVGNLTFLYVTVFIPVLAPVYADNVVYEYMALGILIVFNIFVLINTRDLVLKLLGRSYKNLEFYPVIIGLYLLGIITALLIVQFRLGDINLLFSIVYLVLAIGFILYGFKQGFVYIRRMGLALSLMSTSKLFIFDLSFLEQGSKIFAYFSFGVLLLGISFIYQKVSNNIETNKKTGEIKIVKK